MKQPPLSTTQQCILDYIKGFVMRNGYSPSIREIQAALGISSTSVVAYNLRALAEKGYIEQKRKINRAIAVVGAEPAHECFGVTTPDGHTVRIHGDPAMDERAREALVAMIDLACRQLELGGFPVEEAQR